MQKRIWDVYFYIPHSHRCAQVLGVKLTIFPCSWRVGNKPSGMAATKGNLQGRKRSRRWWNCVVQPSQLGTSWTGFWFCLGWRCSELWLYCRNSFSKIIKSFFFRRFGKRRLHKAAIKPPNMRLCGENSTFHCYCYLQLQKLMSLLSQKVRYRTFCSHNVDGAIWFEAKAKFADDTRKQALFVISSFTSKWITFSSWFRQNELPRHSLTH